MWFWCRVFFPFLVFGWLGLSGSSVVQCVSQAWIALVFRMSWWDFQSSICIDNKCAMVTSHYLFYAVSHQRGRLYFFLSLFRTICQCLVSSQFDLPPLRCHCFVSCFLFSVLCSFSSSSFWEDISFLGSPHTNGDKKSSLPTPRVFISLFLENFYFLEIPSR